VEGVTRRYVRAQRRLIGLLEEQKRALIQRAVTRGLDPDVPLKDSGVEWLGKIPAHWDLRVLSPLLENIEQGWSPVAAEGEITDDQWVVLTLSAVKKGVFHPEAIKPISRSADIPANIEVKSGDFLLTRSNTRQLVGDVCIVDNVRSRTLLCDLIYRLRIQDSILHPRFLMYWLLSPFGRLQIEAVARGSSQTMVKLSQGHIKNWKVPLPPLHQQILIANHLDKFSQKWQSYLTKLERRIDLIREYRTRLIADVVTGKLDVRGADVGAAAP
jgi:type I restriction enzyme S subunit